MYLVYEDDSGSSGDNLADKQSPFQVLSAVVIDDPSFMKSELIFGSFALFSHAVTAGDLPDVPEDFEFHAHQLFHGTKRFSAWSQEKRLTLFEDCMAIVGNLGMPIMYGAIDKCKLSKALYKSANPLDMAFRLCAESIERWFVEHANDSFGALITDNCDEGTKRNLKRVFREYRRRSFLQLSAPKNEFRLHHLIDDMYFGDSADSIGIQIADMCGFLIARHLSGKEDSEYLYKMIEANIYSGKIFPE